MDTSPIALEPQPKKGVKKIIISVIFLGIIIAAVIMWRMQGSSQGTITQGAPVVDEKSVSSKEKIRMEGKYMSFAYLAAYVPVGDADVLLKKDAKEPLKQPENLLQSSFLVIYSATSSRKLAVSVERLKESNFANNTSFTFRKMNPKMYVQGELDINGTQATLFTQNESMHEIAIFMKHGDKDVSIVLSSASESIDAMHDEAIAIAKSVEWKD
jgi:hypothetical protein